MIISLLLVTMPCSLGFSITGDTISCRNNPSPIRSASAMKMGLFDGIAKAFSNEEFKASDQRVRASHILVKGEDSVEKIDKLIDDITERAQKEPDRVLQIFAEIARRESQCPSSAQGGDLGEFGPGKMVKEFDAVLFPEDPEQTPPPAGAIVGPIATDFGCHAILVTKRDANRDQVSPVPHPDRFQR